MSTTTVHCNSEGEWGQWDVPTVNTDDPKELIAAYDALICTQCGSEPCDVIHAWKWDDGIIGYGRADRMELLFATTDICCAKAEEIRSMVDYENDEELLDALRKELDWRQ